MWHFGFGELATTLKKKKVTQDAKKFTNCDSFFYLVNFRVCLTECLKNIWGGPKFSILLDTNGHFILTIKLKLFRTRLL